MELTKEKNNEKATANRNNRFYIMPWMNLSSAYIKKIKTEIPECYVRETDSREAEVIRWNKARMSSENEFQGTQYLIPKHGGAMWEKVKVGGGDKRQHEMWREDKLWAVDGNPYSSLSKVDPVIGVLRK